MQFPDDSHRHAIFGRTGTGKTVFGLWCLSQRSYDKIPWIIIDFKRDMIFKILGTTRFDIFNNLLKAVFKRYLGFIVEHTASFF